MKLLSRQCLSLVQCSSGFFRLRCIGAAIRRNRLCCLHWALAVSAGPRLSSVVFETVQLSLITSMPATVAAHVHI